jgi:hypothetical protein
MADGTGQTVQDGFLVFVDMAVAVGDTVLMQVRMVVLLGHGMPPLIVDGDIIPYFVETCKPPQGISLYKTG